MVFAENIKQMFFTELPVTAPVVFFVDDDEVNRMIMTNAFKKFPYIIKTFKSGNDCLEALKTITPDIFLLDVWMEGMDGFELCSKIRKNPKHDDVPILFITASKDKENRLKGLNAGAVDYITKPFDLAELRLRVKQHLQLRQLHVVLKKQYQYMQKEIASAKKIQAKLLPENNQKLSSSLSFSYSFTPCESLAGDFIDIISLKEDLKLFYLVDVAGHGVASSMITVFVKEFFNQYVDYGNWLFSLEDVVENLNKSILSLKLDQRYLTIFVGVINTKTHKLNWISAGCNVKPFVFFNEETLVLSSPSEAVGWFENVKWKTNETTLPNNSTLFVYSDAAIEIKNENNEELGIDGLKKMVLECGFIRTNKYDDLLLALQRYSKRLHFKDDMSMLAITRQDKE